MAHALNWFEIPVSDINRAARFYSIILAADMAVEEIMGKRRAFLPFTNGVGGTLTQGEGYVPSKDGAMLYLNGGDDLDVVLRRVEPAGGRVIKQKIAIGEYGFVALFCDTEGNRVGLHSRG